MKEKIKIGIILQQTLVEQWIFRILERLCMVDFAEIVVYYIEGKQDQILKNKPSLIFRFHKFLDSWLYRGRYDYNSLIDCSDLIGRAHVFLLKQPELRSNHPDELEATFTLGASKPDILLNFTHKPVSRQFLKLAKYGVLTFKVEGQSYPGSPETAYYCLVTGKQEIESNVTLITNGADEKVVCRSSVSTFSNSIHINCNRVLSLAELLIPRVVEQIYMKDVRSMTKLDEGASKNSSTDLSCFSSPSSYEALKNLIKLHLHSLKKKVLYLDNENWFLLYAVSDTLNPLAVKYNDFTRLKARNGYFWADPFVVYEQGKYFLFVEEYSYKTGLGHLAVLRPDQEGQYRQSEVILKKPYHLSYPFLVKYDGEYFMIPETKSEKVIQIYRCTNFPNSWEYVTNLMENVAAADTTVFYYCNKWWLFTSLDLLKNAAISFGELFLFFADDLFSGRWESHPQNPIVTDISQSRPAGKIFEHDGILIRPSQDCSGGYGKAINLNQITKLTVSEYEEVHIRKIEPTWDKLLTGMHTINFDHNAIVLDACMLRKRFKSG